MHGKWHGCAANVLGLGENGVGYGVERCKKLGIEHGGSAGVRE